MQEADKRRRAAEKAAKQRAHMQQEHLRSGVLGAAHDAEVEEEGAPGPQMVTHLLQPFSSSLLS